MQAQVRCEHTDARHLQSWHIRTMSRLKLLLLHGITPDTWLPSNDSCRQGTSVKNQHSMTWQKHRHDQHLTPVSGAQHLQKAWAGPWGFTWPSKGACLKIHFICKMSYTLGCALVKHIAQPARATAHSAVDDQRKMLLNTCTLVCQAVEYAGTSRVESDRTAYLSDTQPGPLVCLVARHVKQEG